MLSLVLIDNVDGLRQAEKNWQAAASPSTVVGIVRLSISSTKDNITEYCLFDDLLGVRHYHLRR